MFRFYIYASGPKGEAGTITGSFETRELAEAEASVIPGARVIEARPVSQKPPKQYQHWPICPQCGRYTPPWRGKVSP